VLLVEVLGVSGAVVLEEVEGVEADACLSLKKRR